MYIFMYMRLLDITAASEQKKIERKIKYIVVRNCLSKDMDRRIAPEYRRDYDATGVDRWYRSPPSSLNRQCPFANSFGSFSLSAAIGASRHRYDTLKGTRTKEECGGGVGGPGGPSSSSSISASVTPAPRFFLPLFLLPFSTLPWST